MPEFTRFLFDFVISYTLPVDERMPYLPLTNRMHRCVCEEHLLFHEFAF